MYAVHACTHKQKKLSLVSLCIGRMNVLAFGQTAVIFRTPGTSGTVVKFQKAYYTESGGEITALRSVSPYEVDICRLLWLALAPTGFSRHVCLEMERLHGDGNALNVEEFIQAAASASATAATVEGFGSTLRALLFQALYTLSMCTLAFNGLFRHNDLHARNVCFTPWNSAAVPVRAHYTLRCFPDAGDRMFVDRCFLVTSEYRAVVIDYGWAVLLPGLGPDFDSRFFKSGPAAGLGGKSKRIDILATEASFKDSGMSQQVPCQTYDAALLMYSVYTVSVTALAAHTSGVPETVRSELLEFNAFYETMYRGVPHAAGRLPLPLQRHLLRARTVPGTNVVVPTTERLLRSSYFSAFRCGTEFPPDAGTRYSFGCNASDTVLNVDVKEADGGPELKPDNCYLAGGGQPWHEGTPATGSFQELLQKVMKNVQSWRSVTSVRKMTPLEEMEWMDGPATASVHGRTDASKTMPPKLATFVSPCSDAHLPPRKRICVKSPK